MSTEIAKVVTMVLHMSGKSTSKNDVLFDTYLWRYNSRFVPLRLIASLVNSTLGGSHGVPRVHYKGKQGEYYVMVC